MRSAGMSSGISSRRAYLTTQAGERLRRVVARRLLPVAAGEAVDEAASRMDAELPPVLLVAVVDSFLLLVVVQIARRHEPGALERVVGISRLLHLVEVLFGEEPAVREQRFVDRAELVDAELCVRDAPAPNAPALRGAGERHQADDLLQHAVAQLHAVEQRRRTLSGTGRCRGRECGSRAAGGVPSAVASRSVVPPRRAPSKPSRIRPNSVWTAWCR